MTELAEKTESSGSTENSEKTEGSDSSKGPESTEKTESSETSEDDDVPDCFKANDKIQKGENGEYYITVEKFSSTDDDNLDCWSRITQNVYGVSYYTDEGKALVAALKEANGMQNLSDDMIYNGQKIELIEYPIQ